MGFLSALLRPFFYIVEDLLEQSLVMIACIGWGWLSVIIMVASFIDGAPALLELIR